MNYQALYRKYRPQRFDEVVGQDHITETLAREVVEEKVAHAYLFTGPRGTGKTTSARLLAKSLNCSEREDRGEPCNKCNSCTGITAGSSIDVIELDAASHNKVEDIREIRVNVSTVAAADRARRVYILDEAHMLSRAASNALLKTLEEPPEHVIFVLATTEPYKLLDTIRSRTQRFDFRPVASETLTEHLASIAERENFNYGHDALGAITNHAGGSVRDALSLLEQVAVLGGGEVTSLGVSKALGIAPSDSYGKLLEVVAAGDAAGGISLIAGLASQGTDLRRFVADTIEYLRGVFLAQYADNIEEVVDASSETIERWRGHAASVPSNEVLRSIDELSTALLQLRDGREERLIVELAILKLTRPETVPDIEGVSTRLDRVERRLGKMERREVPRVSTQSSPASDTEQLGVSKKPTPAPDRPFQIQDTSREPEIPEVHEVTKELTKERETPEVPDTPDTNVPEVSVPERTEPPLTLNDFEAVWPAIVAQIRKDVGPSKHALLKEAKPAAIENGVVVFEVAPHMHFHLEQLRTDSVLSDAIIREGGDRLNRSISVKFRSGKAVVIKERVEVQRERVPDKDDLLEATGNDGSDAAANVLDVLGGEILGD